METEPQIDEAAFNNERQVVRKAGRQAIGSFLEQHTCFSVLRASGKVVVFDVRIPIQLAFYALVEHDMQAAPLWDPSLCQFVGLLTVTDFISILLHYRATRADPSALATRTIANVLSDAEILKVLHRKSPSFLAADTSTTLKEACKLMHAHALDFLPILMPEDMRVLALLTYTNMLEHLVAHFREQRRLFDDSIYDLHIGTYHEDLVVTHPHTPLHEALELMQRHQLSAIPVVDANPIQSSSSEQQQNHLCYKLLGVYSRSDICFLAPASDAADAIRNLDLTLGELLQQQRSDVTTPDALHTCSTAHTLQSIFEYFAQLKFNRLFLLNEQQYLVGVVSARDLVAYFLGQE